MKKTFVVVILLFSGIVCGSILMYFFSPQSVLPKNFDATHVSSIIVSVFQPWIDKTLSKKVEDTTGKDVPSFMENSIEMDQVPARISE